MNERIKELYNQCFVVLEHDTPNTGFDFEKYTELIVQDCISQIALVGLSNFENDDNGDISWTASKCIENIKKHFDV